MNPKSSRLVSGSVSIEVPGVTQENPITLQVDGQTHLKEGSLRSAGDGRGISIYFYIHQHKENWIDGNDLADRIAQAAGSGAQKSNGKIRFAFQTAQTVSLYADNELSFNDNTVYTVRFRIRASAVGEITPVSVLYLDGTSVGLTVDQAPDYDGFANICYHSNPLKTLKSVVLNICDSSEHELDYTTFGIFHGEKPFAFFEEYEGERSRFKTRSVLMGVGDEADTVDVTKSTVTTRFKMISGLYGGQCTQVASDGIFIMRYPLETPARVQNPTLLSNKLTPVSSFAELQRTERGVMVEEGGNALLISWTSLVHSIAAAGNELTYSNTSLIYRVQSETVSSITPSPVSLMKGTHYFDIGTNDRIRKIRLVYR